MADKQINDLAVTPLTDTDSLIKQSVTGLTGKATLTDIKSNLDGRYTQRGTVIWEEEGGSSLIVLSTPLSTIHNYEVYVDAYVAEMAAGRMVLKGNPSPSGEPWIAFISSTESVSYVYGVGSTVAPIQVGGVAGHRIYKIIDLGEVL